MFWIISRENRSKRFLCYLLNSKVMYLQEKRREEEEAETQLDMQLAQEAAHAKMAREISNEVC